MPIDCWMNYDNVYFRVVRCIFDLAHLFKCVILSSKAKTFQNKSPAVFQAGL